MTINHACRRQMTAQHSHETASSPGRSRTRMMPEFCRTGPPRWGHGLQGDAWPLHAQHVRYEALRHQELVAPGPVIDHEGPARQPLLDPVTAIARHRTAIPGCGTHRHQRSSRPSRDGSPQATPAPCIIAWVRAAQNLTSSGRPTMPSIPTRPTSIRAPSRPPRAGDAAAGWRTRRGEARGVPSRMGSPAWPGGSARCPQSNDV